MDNAVIFPVFVALVIFAALMTFMWAFTVAPKEFRDVAGLPLIIMIISMGSLFLYYSTPIFEGRGQFLVRSALIADKFATILLVVILYKYLFNITPYSTLCAVINSFREAIKQWTNKR